jgi:hypothetical protein
MGVVITPLDVKKSLYVVVFTGNDMPISLIHDVEQQAGCCATKFKGDDSTTPLAVLEFEKITRHATAETKNLFI